VKLATTKTNKARQRSQGAAGPKLIAADALHDFGPTLDRVVPFTMPPVNPDVLTDLARLVREVLTQGIPGDFVACGVWRGGTAFLMADLLRRVSVEDRKVWLFDSWEGMPPPKAVDGPYARECVKDPNNPLHPENSRVSVREVRRSAKNLGLAPYTVMVQGWFDQTLPAQRQRIGPIALLHIDCDWYASVRCCLENLYDQVVDGGFVVFDDYYHYDGCAVAVHEFLGKRRLPHRLESIVGQWGGCEYYYGTRLRKGDANWPWRHQVRLAGREIAALVPPGETFILVDEQQLDTESIDGRHALPFLEKEGHCWGSPKDDAMAIRELERMRRAGASFLIFAWPAFWWLEHYAGFHRYLRRKFRCLLENECLIAFDLRRER
jgi:O-methyltransferase